MRKFIIFLLSLIVGAAVISAIFYRMNPNPERKMGKKPKTNKEEESIA